MKALMCFMYELAPPVWQRLVCCLNRTLLAMAELPFRACRLAFLSFLLASTLCLGSKWPNGSCWMKCDLPDMCRASACCWISIHSTAPLGQILMLLCMLYMYVKQRFATTSTRPFICVRCRL